MKIMQISPGSFDPEEIKMRQEYAESLCLPGTRVTVVNVESPAAKDAVGLALIPPGELKRVEEAEREGYDAIVTAGPALEAIKTATKIPVVGLGETTYHVACLLADRFGVITIQQAVVPVFWRRAKGLGVADRITSIKTLDIPPVEFRQRKAELEARFIELAKEHISEGAQLIIAFCGPILLTTLGVGSRKRLSEKLGIPILDPTATALRIAEVLVNLGIAQSPKAFPLFKELQQRPYVLFVGSEHPRKNFARVLTAFSRLKRLECQYYIEARLKMGEALKAVDVYRGQIMKIHC